VSGDAIGSGEILDLLTCRVSQLLGLSHR
jgi:hypothetical protein